MSQLNTKQLLPVIVVSIGFAAVTHAFAWEPKPGWRDSYAVDGICYCDTSNYDHGIGTKTVLAPDGFYRSVRQICVDIEDRFGKGSTVNRIPYNTIACGNGPANDAADEHLVNGCPGRVDMGAAGCFEIGPGWPLAHLYGPPMKRLDRSVWSISSNKNTKQLSALADGNATTRWTTSEKQSVGQWLEIDMGDQHLINQIVMDTTGSPQDYAREVRLESHTRSGEVEVIPYTAATIGEITRLVLPPTELRKLRIVQTGTTDHWYWSIHELHVGYLTPE